MKRILVPIDFSSISEKVLRFAVNIAHKTGGNITAYHLIVPETINTVGIYHDVKVINEQKELNSLKRLQRLRKKASTEFPGIIISTVVHRKPVVGNILKFAKDNYIDLIVMGTQGASGLRKVTVGSVAAKVISQSDIPVLLVPEKYTPAPLKNIVFTTNFDTAEGQAFPFLFKLAGYLDAVITFVSLAKPNKKSSDEIEKNIESYGYVLQREYNDAKMQFRQLITTSVTDSLENLYHEVPYDLMVMARRKLAWSSRFFKQSFTKKMAYITTLPLLIIPEKEVAL